MHVNGLIHGLIRYYPTSFAPDVNNLVLSILLIILGSFAILLACRGLDIEASFGSVFVFVIIVNILNFLAKYLFGHLSWMSIVFLQLIIAKYYFDVGWIKAMALMLVSLLMVIVVGVIGSLFLLLLGIA